MYPTLGAEGCGTSMAFMFEIATDASNGCIFTYRKIPQIPLASEIDDRRILGHQTYATSIFLKNFFNMFIIQYIQYSI